MLERRLTEGERKSVFYGLLDAYWALQSLAETMEECGINSTPAIELREDLMDLRERILGDG